MKKLIISLTFIALLSCADNSPKMNSVQIAPSKNEITKEMGCENCGMNIERFIKTGHVIQTEDGVNHHFCSINCCTNSWNRNNYSNASVFAIDQQSVEYMSADSLYYVIGSSQPPVMSKVSKYAFKDSSAAEEFKIKYEGDSIVRYSDAFKMCEEELAKR